MERSEIRGTVHKFTRWSRISLRSSGDLSHPARYTGTPATDRRREGTHRVSAERDCRRSERAMSRAMAESKPVPLVLVARASSAAGTA